MKIRGRTGTVTGYTHTRKGLNNQDKLVSGVVEIDGKFFVYGAVLDGCTNRQFGRDSHNEVGAILLADFIESEIPMLLRSHIPFEQIPDALYRACLGFLNTIPRSTIRGDAQAIWTFIQKRLLATIFGFLMNEETLLVFNAGDGVCVFNDQIMVIDQQNMPDYIAYHLVDRAILGSAADKIPTTFDLRKFSVQELKRFAICTDGIKEAWTIGENPLEAICGIWEYQPEAQGGLQWWLNIKQQDAIFSDDCTVITIELPTQTPPKPTEAEPPKKEPGSSEVGAASGEKKPNDEQVPPTITTESPT